MKKILKVTAAVKEILTDKPQTRDNDNLLWLEVIKKASEGGEQPFEYLSVSCMLKYIYSFGIPTFETVSRSRRKLQAKYPELRGTERVRRERAKKEKTFKEYSKNGVV